MPCSLLVIVDTVNNMDLVLITWTQSLVSRSLQSGNCKQFQQEKVIYKSSKNNYCNITEEGGLIAYMLGTELDAEGATGTNTGAALVLLELTVWLVF